LAVFLLTCQIPTGVGAPKRKGKPATKGKGKGKGSGKAVPKIKLTDEWKDILDSVVLPRDRVVGKWQRTGNGIKSLETGAAKSPARLMLSAVTPDDYEMEVVFVRQSDKGKVGLMLDVGPGAVTLYLDMASKTDGRILHGLAMVDGKNPADGGVSVEGQDLGQDTEHTVVVRVRIFGMSANFSDLKASIRARLDGKEILNWEGRAFSLSIPDSQKLPRRDRVGLFAMRSTLFKSVRMRRLTGPIAPPVDPLDRVTTSKPGGSLFEKPKPVAPAPKPVPPPLSPHEQYYKDVCDLYMAQDYEGMNKAIAAGAKNMSRLAPAQRANILYARKAVPDHRPAWWKYCASSHNTTFTAKIWGKSFKANYIPSDTLGVQAPIGIRDGRIIVIVSWQPRLVGDPEPVEGARAKAHKLTRGDFAESIAWHELGHNYITEFLPLSTILRLYNDYQMMFHQLQEFYADMTTLYHAGPKARRCQLFVRLSGLSLNRDSSAHMRAAYGIGSILLSEWLADPTNIKEKWPHIHLPPVIPEKDIERNVLVYAYYHFDPAWSLEEDRAFRELIKSSLTSRKAGSRYTEGEMILRRKGAIHLPNKLEYRFMPAEDRPWKAKRDAWVKQQLAKAIKAGQTDTKEEAKEIDLGELIGSPEIHSLIPR